MSLRDAVERTATALALHEDDQSAAAVELLRLYASEIDRSAAVARASARILRAAEAGEDVDLYEAVAALRAKLTERETLDRLGARAHAMLSELLATPKARPETKSAPGPAGALAKLRAVK